MSAGRPGDGIVRRLRDDPAHPAREIIRAIDPPRPLGRAADARVLAALEADRTRSWPASFRQRRWLVPVLTIAGNCGAGLAAAAALRWVQTDPARESIAVLAAPAEEPAPAPAPAAAPREATVTLAPAAAAPVHPRRSARPGAKPHFSRALLAIDPKDEHHRPDIPPDFARAHAGEVFSWRVKICVSATGSVTGATVLDRVHPLLDRRIGRAIETWRYVPAQQGGRPVHTCTALSYRLALEPPGWVDTPSEDGAD